MFRNEDLSSKKNFDDCYFYYYSTCKKGTSCPFRHCEAALGTEVVCSLWQAGKCFRLSCPLRHMESQRDRSTIACYWENQPGGCRKPHCVFRHCRPREGLDNSSTNKDLILPVAAIDPEESKWVTVPSNRIVVQNSGQEQKNWMTAPAEEEENSLSLPPAVEPLVVCFDEESDTESCTSTPVKAPEKERRVQLLSCDALEKIQITPVRKLNTKKGKLKKSTIELGIKTLQEIREEKTHITSKATGSSTGDGSIVELIGDNCNEADSKKAKDLRIKIQQKRTAATKPDSITTDKNLDFKVKTLEEIRKEKAQPFKDLDDDIPSKEMDDIIIQGETKENKVSSLKNRKLAFDRKERIRKAVKEEIGTSLKRRKLSDTEKNETKEFRVKSLDEIREERKLRELQKSKNSKVEAEEESGNLDASSLKSRHPRITFKGSNPAKQEKRKSAISSLAPFLNKRFYHSRREMMEESRKLVNYESEFIEPNFNSSDERLMDSKQKTDLLEEVSPFRDRLPVSSYQNVILSQSPERPDSNDSSGTSNDLPRPMDEVSVNELELCNDSNNDVALESQASTPRNSDSASSREPSVKEIVTPTKRKRLESSSSRSVDSCKTSQRKQSSRDFSDGGIDLDAELSLLLDDDEEDLSTTDLKEEDLLLELDEIINS